jgi:hypothetical protein
MIWRVPLATETKRRAAMAIVTAEEQARGHRVELPGSWANERLYGCDLLSYPPDSGEPERVEVKGWGEPILTSTGRFTYGQDIRASQVAAVLGDAPFRLEIVANLDAHLNGGADYQRLTLSSSEIRSRLMPRLYEIPLAGLEDRVRVGPPGVTQAADLAESHISEWPHPEPGPGMLPNGEGFRWPRDTRDVISCDVLRTENVPDDEATWSEIEWFSTSFDGYDYYGGNDRLGPIANTLQDYFSRLRLIPPTASLDMLRAALFFEHRRYHDSGHAPGAEAVPYIRALVRTIRGRVERSSEGI